MTIILFKINRGESDFTDRLDGFANLSAGAGDKAASIATREALKARESAEGFITVIGDTGPARSEVTVGSIDVLAFEAPLEFGIAAGGFVVELSKVGDGPDWVVDVGTAEGQVSRGGDFAVVKTGGDDDVNGTIVTEDTNVVVSVVDGGASGQLKGTEGVVRGTVVGGRGVVVQIDGALVAGDGVPDFGGWVRGSRHNKLDTEGQRGVVHGDLEEEGLVVAIRTTDGARRGDGGSSELASRAGTRGDEGRSVVGLEEDGVGDGVVHVELVRAERGDRGIPGLDGEIARIDDDVARTATLIEGGGLIRAVGETVERTRVLGGAAGKVGHRRVTR